MRKKLLLAVGVAVSVLSVAACGGGDDDANDAPSAESTETSETSDSEAMPEPDLDAIPDVVAVVNGSEISKTDFIPAYESHFQQLAMQAQMSGQEVDQAGAMAEVAESMVNTELLLQEADARGFEASDEAVNETLTELATANGLASGDEFTAAMVEQGMTEEQVLGQLERQVKLTQLFEDEAGDAPVSEEEVQALYDQISAEQQQMAGGDDVELPPLEEIRPDLEQQVITERQNQASQSLVDQAREDAEITINV